MITINENPRFYEITCECGEVLKGAEMNGWKINIIGMLQFKCTCGKIINAPDVLLTEDTK